MAKLLALDIGKKRIGIAETDFLQMIASPVKTVKADEIWDFLKIEFSMDAPELVVLGMPKGLDGKETDGTAYVHQFMKRFKKLFPNMPMEEEDERFTSKMAVQAMNLTGHKVKGNKEMIDEISAAIILQSYLERTKK